MGREKWFMHWSIHKKCLKYSNRALALVFRWNLYEKFMDWFFILNCENCSVTASHACIHALQLNRKTIVLNEVWEIYSGHWFARIYASCRTSLQDNSTMVKLYLRKWSERIHQWFKGAFLYRKATCVFNQFVKSTILHASKWH